MNTQAINVVRGSAFRTLRSVGWQFVIGVCLLLSGLWIFAKDSSSTKVGASVAILACAGIVLLCVCVASSFAIAELQNHRLNFYFCGIRTRSILLDSSIFFELRKIGRLEILCIHSNGSTYVPNGALSRTDLVDLLLAHGIAEGRVE